MSNLAKWTILVAALLLLASCATAPQTTAAIGAGVAGLATVFNELAGSGVMTPVQHIQAQHALEAITQTVSAAQQAAQLATSTAAAAKAGGINTGEFATGLTGVALATAGAVNTWRNVTRQKALARTVVV